MAQDQQNTSGGEARSFDKALNEDINDFHLGTNSWTQARNAINNSKSGDLGKLGNEPANYECIRLTNTSAVIIGFIHVIEDKWIVFSVDPANISEIGVFDESTCKYDTIVTSTCLNFKLENLIVGTSRATSNCTYNVYWDDGINPSRVLEIDVYTIANNFDDHLTKIPWVKICNNLNGCQICTNTTILDCDKIRLALFIDPICPRVEKGFSGGNLLNGSYMVAMAYAINGQKISDWYISNIQGLFDHDNSASSLDVFIDSIDQRFDEIIVATVATINQQTVVRRAGLYSTRQTRLSFDVIFDTWPTIPIEQLPIMTPIIDKSDAMYNVGDYLIRVGPTTKFDFNYQPLANQIVAKWQSIEYPADYYHKGGNNTGYMRDEVYAFFIEWIYDTGDTSASYPIPGRPSVVYSPLAPLKDTSAYVGTNALTGDTMLFETFNTATVSTTFPLPPAVGSITLPDGGVVIEEGYMGYWESSELYPDNKPVIWNASDLSHPWSSVVSTPYPTTQISDYDLCGRPIRHHRFPEDSLSINTQLFQNGGDKIRIMGVKFENVQAPRDNEGFLIPGIIGYRILRGTRNGNKTIIAKGIINNMGEYDVPGSTTKALYPNYPYNDLHADPFLSQGQTSTNASGQVVGDGTLLQNFQKDYFTFHSPETNFSNPFLSNRELRLYGNVYGNVEGKFDYSEKHPKEKLITDLTFIIASIAGVGAALLAANGQRRTNYTSPKWQGYSFKEHYVAATLETWLAPYGNGAVSTSTVLTSTFPTNASPTSTDALSAPIVMSGVNSALSLMNVSLSLGSPISSLLLGQTADQLTESYLSTSNTAAFSSPGPWSNSTIDIQQDDGNNTRLGGVLSGIAGAPLFLQYFTEGTDSFLRLIKAILRYRDFAVRYHSHGYYNQFDRIRPSTFRFPIEKQTYIRPEIANIDNNLQINNLYRNKTVSIKVTGTVTNPTVPDFTRANGSMLGIYKVEDLVNTSINSSLIPGTGFQTCSSHYVGLKVRIKNQYSQLNNIVQLQVNNCYTPVTFNVATNGKWPDGNILTGGSTTPLFGGDIYINRYTEKNTFFYFYDWLEGQPDGAQLDYNQHKMVAYPRYWANFNEFQTSDFTTTFTTAITPPFSGLTGATGITVPSKFYALDGSPFTQNSILSFAMNTFQFDKRGWFYLFNSGVRDFFVESEINVAYRDYGQLETEKFYDPYAGGDTKTLFNTAIIKSGNYYKYDISLSVSKLFSNYTSWATMQSPQYNPFISETCYVYRPKRVIYSLPAQYEGIKDGWRVFLTNNYYDFNNYVTCIKPINKSGAIIFFDAASPVQFQGTDQLETGLGTKLTIGDGGLFSQPLQALINVESSHEYGSCQNRMSVINTPAGVYWISQNQGKIFTVAGQGIKEVSNVNMKWWFAQFLPYNIVESYPDFELLDNPVLGVACQSVYNNQDGLVYFCKKDYKLRADAPDIPVYLGSNNFLVNDFLVIKLGDPNDTVWPVYFEDASWTISYDPKTDGWVGYHDWHPTFTLPGKNTFMTVDPTSRNSIWVHNVRCDLYCNYYGIDYPFEVEFTVNTVQEVNTLRSIQYQLECYKYAPNCYDRFHELDFNFDEATIYNTEQTSGLLKLVLNPKQDPTAILRYPIINPTNINVLFSKEENKYRFNQFWDVTDDRGEYFNSLIPGYAQRTIWNTGANGYVRVLNTYNLNYNKGPFQRKKFRHYTVSVLLRKLVSGNTKMLVMLADTKTLLSPR